MPATAARDHRAIMVLALVCIALFGCLIVTRMELFYTKNEASDYRALWRSEMDKRRLALADPRIEAIEKRTQEVAEVVRHQSPEVRHDIKRRLDSIRVHFASGLHRDGRTKACPAPKPAIAAPAVVPTPGPDAAPDPRPVLTDRHKGIDRDNADRMERLQAWVRQHMAAWHGVTI